MNDPMRRKPVKACSRSARALAIDPVRRPLRRQTVGFLTARRRWADVFSSSSRAQLLGIIGSALVLTGSAHATSWHPVGDLGTTAEAFLRDYIGAADERITVKAARLDPRLQLPRCTEAPEAFLQRGSKMASRMTVGVRCDGLQPWKIYVTVDVVVEETVLVAARTLASGHVLQTGDVVAAKRDVAALTSGYVSKPENLVGRRLKHQLIEGRIMTPAMMTADIAVRRGQSVTLTVRSKSLNIRMEGKALMDGSVNQRIRVENSRTRRVVEGIVRSPEHVEVLVF